MPLKNKDKHSEYMKKYRQENRDSIREYERVYNKVRCPTKIIKKN